MLEQYYFLDEQVARQTGLLQQLSATELYRERVEILTIIPGIGTLIRKDGVMQEKYDRLKSRSGGKRTIIAVARTLLIRMTRLLLDNNPYVVGLFGTN